MPPLAFAAWFRFESVSAPRSESTTSPPQHASGLQNVLDGKLRDELLARAVFDMPLEANVLIERWRKAYNTVRPYRSLGYRLPEARRCCSLPHTTRTVPQRTYER